MHPEEVKARFSNAMSMFKEMNVGTDGGSGGGGGGDQLRRMKRTDSSDATRALWKAAATVVVDQSRRSRQQGGQRRTSITNNGKIISSPLTKKTEKMEQNKQLKLGMSRLINHQRKRSSSASLTLQGWDITQLKECVHLEGVGEEDGEDGARGSRSSGSRSPDVLTPASPVVVALSNLDAVYDTGKVFLLLVVGCWLLVVGC